MKHTKIALAFAVLAIFAVVFSAFASASSLPVSASGKSCNSKGKCKFVPYCIDSDHGFKEYVFGTITYMTSPDQVFMTTDYCVGNTLIEGGCSGSKFVSKSISCKYGCSKGVCLKKISKH
jgi:hypothetical protein